MDILEELTWRGLLHQSTDPAELAAHLKNAPQAVYAGFDPTADSLHVGHLMGVMALRRFQQAGHKPIALVGGATGMIGDPSGKSEERSLLSEDVLRANVEGMRAQISKFLDFEAGPCSALLVNNYDWMSPFSYLQFLRDVGKHFPVNVMLAKDSVQSRLSRTDTGLSYTEFSYMLLQAYDFVHLHRKHQCGIQIGGSDQWGNITAGIDLGRRLIGASLHGMTWPLLTKADGSKMGKTEKGAIWLSEQRTSPYRFFQYWINADDADVDKLLRYFTDLPKEEIEGLAAEHDRDPGKRVRQRRVAEELTRLVHGESGLTSARKASEVLFGAEMENLSDELLAEIFADVPSKELPRQQLVAGLSLIDALCAADLAKSKSDARRTIEQGGGYVNNRRADSIETTLGQAQLVCNQFILLRSGKKKYGLLRFI